MTDHDHDHGDGEEECWNCGGEGYTYMCQDEIGCVDPESGCDLCMRRCWVCNQKPKDDKIPATPNP